MPDLLSFPRAVLAVSYRAAQITIGAGLDTIDRLRTNFEAGPVEVDQVQPAAAEDDLLQARADAKREARRLERQAREGT